MGRTSILITATRSFKAPPMKDSGGRRVVVHSGARSLAIDDVFALSV